MPDRSDAQTEVGVGDGSDIPLPTFANGTVLDGKYAIEEVIAQGGTGIILRARHVVLDQLVAIKYLRPAALANPTLVEQFIREGRLAAQIASEHVVRVHDVALTADSGPYMVMEYLRGQDLGHVLESGPLTVPRAIDYLLQACDALAHAHALGIVHRDLKPENLFLAQVPPATPRVKIIDFGISKVAPGRGEAAARAHDQGEANWFGTPLYMSPEQLRAVHVDGRADLWALGVVLFELLTRQVPFEGEDVGTLTANVLGAEPRRLSHLRPGVPPGLEAVILRCLEKDRDRRYRNVAELAQELARFGPPDAHERAARIVAITRRSGASIRPPTPPPGSLETHVIRDLLPPAIEAPAHPQPSRPSRAWLVAAGALIGAVLVVATFLWVRGRTSPTIAAAAAPPPVESVLVPVPVVAAPQVAPAPPSAEVSSASAASSTAPPAAVARPRRPATVAHGRDEFGERK